MTHSTNLNEKILNEGITILQQMKFPKIFNKINKLYQLIEETFNNNGKLILIGNGGSASDSQHIACEFIGIGLPAMSLSSNIASITAIANDKTYDNIFIDQLVALKPSEKDMLIALTTSGNSINILKTVLLANDLHITTVGITGNQTKNRLSQETNIQFIIQIPSSNTQRIQEATMLIFHLIYDKIKQDMHE